ncbi:hypothetical protein [Parasitella parasitica]|uniref:Uncharacterized protein n=1 Tax=Parasitella parasitica TaxID=35722 RepID=A0A0B7NE79_9FUNG|nr:hypothetical protein [Parasitella parasitica]
MKIKTKKRVRFSNQNTINYTHSASEYDRSCFATDPSSTSPGASSIEQPTRVQQGQQAVIYANPPIVYSQQKQLKQKPPPLWIDTAVNSGLGPLFLTGNSTKNYYTPFRKSIINQYVSITNLFVDSSDNKDSL